MDAATSFFALLQTVIKLGALAFLIGIAFQTYIVITYNKPWTWGELTFLLIMSRVAAFGITVVIWQYWPASVSIQEWLLFFPALIAEAVTSPIALKVFKQNIFGKPTKYV